MVAFPAVWASTYVSVSFWSIFRLHSALAFDAKAAPARTIEQNMMVTVTFSLLICAPLPPGSWRPFYGDFSSASAREWNFGGEPLQGRLQALTGQVCFALQRSNSPSFRESAIRLDRLRPDMESFGGRSRYPLPLKNCGVNCSSWGSIPCESNLARCFCCQCLPVSFSPV